MIEKVLTHDEAMELFNKTSCDLLKAVMNKMGKKETVVAVPEHKVYELFGEKAAKYWIAGDTIHKFYSDSYIFYDSSDTSGEKVEGYLMTAFTLPGFLVLVAEHNLELLRRERLNSQGHEIGCKIFQNVTDGRMAEGYND